MEKKTFLRQVYKLLVASLEIGEDTISAAQAGAIIKKSNLPDRNEFGFARAMNLFRALADESLVELVKTQQNADAIKIKDPQLSFDQIKPRYVYRARHLRQEVWLAFTGKKPSAYDHRTGHIEFGVNVSSDGRSVKNADVHVIHPIPAEQEAAWRTRFADEQVVAHHPGVELPKDPESFRAKLRSLNSKLLRNWNRQRTQHVNEWVEAWCEERSLDIDDLNKPSLDTLRVSHGFHQAEKVVDPGERSQKKAILKLAIDLMPDSELGDLPIPIKYVLAASETLLNSEHAKK